MARRSKKFFKLWFLLLLAALVGPFQSFLAAKQYQSANEFFEEILDWVITGSVLLSPFFILFLVLRARRRKKNSDRKQEKNES